MNLLILGFRPRFPLYKNNSGIASATQSCISPYILSIAKKYTTAYTAAQSIDQAICFFGSPLFVPIDSTLSDAIQLQSAGSATAQISKVKITFAGILISLLSAIRSRTSPHASDHMTLVWLRIFP